MIQYRYRGRFITEARARALSRLRGPSRFVSTSSGPFHALRYIPPEKAKREAQRLLERERRKRSEAARRGWEKRLEKARRRSEAARRGWEKRRLKEAAPPAPPRKKFPPAEIRPEEAPPPAPPRKKYPPAEIRPEEAPPPKVEPLAPEDLAWGWDIKMMDPRDPDYIDIVDKCLWDLATDDEEEYEEAW